MFSIKAKTIAATFQYNLNFLAFLFSFVERLSHHKMHFKSNLIMLCTFLVINNCIATSSVDERFWADVVQKLKKDPNVIQAVIKDPANDPIKTALLRPITGGSRVEYVEAWIYPSHLRTPSQRTSFGSNDKTYMQNVLQSINKDEMGHLVASSLGGKAEKYNLAPQSPFANRNVGARPTTISWFNLEDQTREWLGAEKAAGKTNSYVRWRVALAYTNTNVGRPARFSFQATRFRNNVAVVNGEIVAYDICNGDPSSATSCPRKN